MSRGFFLNSQRLKAEKTKKGPDPKLARSGALGLHF